VSFFEDTVDGFFSSGMETDFTITTASGLKNIKAIFLNEHEVRQAGDLQFTGSNPVAGIKTSEAADAKQNDICIHNGINYKVQEVQPDGTGFTILVLKYA
jgi:hypothetical protein